MARLTALQRRNLRRRRPAPAIRWTHIAGLFLGLLPVLALVARTEHAAAPCVPLSTTLCR